MRRFLVKVVTCPIQIHYANSQSAYVKLDHTLYSINYGIVSYKHYIIATKWRLCQLKVSLFTAVYTSSCNDVELSLPDTPYSHNFDRLELVAIVNVLVLCRAYLGRAWPHTVLCRECCLPCMWWTLSSTLTVSSLECLACRCCNQNSTMS